MRNSQVGDLLVASTEVDGTVLNRGVCLLVYEDDQTAIGLMLNRPFQLVPAIVPDGHASALPTGPLSNAAGSPQPPRQLHRLSASFASGELDIADTIHHPILPKLKAPTKQVVALVGSAEHPDAGKMLEGKSLYFGGPLAGPLVAVHGAAELGETEAGEGIFVAAQRDHLEALLREGQPHPYRLIVGHLGWTQTQLSEEIAAGVWHRLPATPEILSTADEWLWPKLIRSATATSVSRWLGLEHVAHAHVVN